MSKHGRGALVTLGLILAIGMSLVGCGASSSSPQAFVVPAPPAQQGEYVIQPGDAIDISFYFHPDNNQQNVLVRPDGKILINPIGEIQAAGLTTPQLAEEIAKRSAANLRDPKVAVNVRTLSTTRIFVGGEVAKAGFIDFRAGITAVQALVQAGGWKDTADLQEVVLLQKIGETGNEYRPTKINISKVVNDGDTKADILLAPSDVIVVPKTGIAKANVWMQQYVINMIPIRISATPF